MIDKSLGVRSRGLPPFSRRNRGFSLVEIMMSVVLLAISAALALPSYRDMIEKRQVTHGAEQLASFINAAQGAAMKTNRLVTVSYSRTAANDWCVGAVAGATACDCTVTDTSASNYCQIGAQDFIIDNSSSNDREILHSIDGDGAYAFDPVRGLFVDLDDSLSMELHSNSGDFRLSLQVNSVGRVRLCSTDASHSVPGYPVCEATSDWYFVEAES